MSLQRYIFVEIFYLKEIKISSDKQMPKERHLFLRQIKKRLGFVFAKIKQILHHCAFLARMLVVEKKDDGRHFCSNRRKLQCNIRSFR